MAALGWLLNLDFAASGADAPPPVVVAAPTAAGKGKRRYVIEIDGQDFIVADQQQAVELLQRARAIAEQAAERKAVNVEKRLRKRAVVPAVSLEAPSINVPFELREATASIVADIERLYERASIEMELRLLLLKQQEMDDDDEDVVLLS